MAGKLREKVIGQHNSDLDEILIDLSKKGYTLREAANVLSLKYDTLKHWAAHFEVKFPTEYAVRHEAIKALAKKYNINPTTVSDRLRNGWELEDALKTPVRQGNWTYRKQRETKITTVSQYWLRRKWK